MPERRIVNAIVLRSVNYRDFDRILTLFSREEGKISAAARGAHRAKSPLAAASTQFTAGEFALEEPSCPSSPSCWTRRFIPCGRTRGA